jgi:hypothetical protein
MKDTERRAQSAPSPQITIEELRCRHTCSVEAAAVILGIGRSTAYAAARDGSLPTLRFSHRLLVPTSKLLALLGYEDSDRPD